MEIAYRTGVAAAAKVIESEGLEPPRVPEYAYVNYAYTSVEPEAAPYYMDLRDGPSGRPLAQPSREYADRKEEWERSLMGAVFGSATRRIATNQRRLSSSRVKTDL